ncbi:MAG: ATP-binding protein [Desulfuromonadales bacterium]
MKLRFRSLFIKIFLWFWLVTALTGVILFVVAVIGDSARNREVQQLRVEERRRLMGETLAFYGETAIKLLSLEGSQALDAYSDQLARTVGIQPYFFMEPNRPRPNAKVPHVVMDLAKRSLLSGKAEYATERDQFVLAQPMKNASGGLYVIVGKTRLDPTQAAAPETGRPPPEVEDAPRSRREDEDRSFQAQNGATTGKQTIPLKVRFVSQAMSHLDRYSRDLGKILVIMFIVGGLACYLLTWHLTAPLRRLQLVAQQIAGGKLSARVDPNLNQRGDEIAELGGDLNRMAERIEGLINSQQRLMCDISHELRSPLTRLGVALDLARKSAGSAATGSLDRIERESNRLNELIGQLLTLTKLENDNACKPGEEVDLAALLAEIARDVDFEVKGGSRRVDVVTCTPVNLTGNRELLRQAFENVVRNAIRYTADNSNVELALSVPELSLGSRVVVEVRDHGCGVPEKDLLNIFRPFYRVSDGRERESGGIGIGLAITERAVRLHGGSIQALNAEAGGLIVRIELPLCFTQQQNRP